ncbi:MULTISPECIES: hypothetical protein [unclassified Pseudomonas]|uniref:hypothetical protein n=1 Tax=unclassified Pseudomonas TaxID=196821 RepID=UPI001314A66E
MLKLTPFSIRFLIPPALDAVVSDVVELAGVEVQSVRRGVVFVAAAHELLGVIHQKTVIAWAVDLVKFFA